MKKIIVLIVILVILIVTLLGFLKYQNDSVLSLYSKDLYSIKYLKDFNIKNIGTRTTFLSKNYNFNMTTGSISSGFKMEIFENSLYDFDRIFECEDIIEIDNCLLARSESQIDYNNGEIKYEKINKYGLEGVKYKFISNKDGNNNIGIVLNKNDTSYVVIIVFNEIKDEDLFNEIINSFEVK